MLNEKNRDARRLYWAAQDQRAGTNESQLAADPLVAQPAQQRALSKGPETLFGRVVDAIPYVGTYKVLPERGLNAVTCCYLAPGPNTALGARGISTIAPGAQVWFLYHPDSNYGVILGVEPQFMTQARKAISDYIFVGSRSGLHRDAANNYPFSLNTRGIGDWSARTPFDSTTGGEWGAITETGLRVVLDSAMVQLGVGESCGIYCYIWDQLCRIAGVNLQIRASAFEREALDDVGEHFDVIQRFVYPWESYGTATPGTPTGRALDAQATEIDEPWYGACEPKQDDQVGIPRYLEFGGYLGQGGKRLIQVPAPGGLWGYENPGAAATVFEEQLSLTGSYTLRSAKRVIIARRPLIPSIRTQKRPEDNTGDTRDNYRASGQFGSGPEHVVKGEPALPEQSQDISAGTPLRTDDMMLRALGVTDLMAYTFNWEAEHALHYHGKDWQVTEETGSLLGSSLTPPDFSPLVEHAEMYMEPAETGSLTVDHRYKSVKYALSSSYFALLDDGGIVLGDGFGAELRLAGGHVFITAPGDVWNKAGRNVVSWGGRDVLLRGKHHVDITATERDVRIKAEKHLWALAGNGGGDGLLLLESRAGTKSYVFQDADGKPKIGEDAVAGGIALRTEISPLVNWASQIYLRTGGGDVADGDITLDASRGRCGIATNIGWAVNFLNSASSAGRYDAYYEGDEQATQVKKVHAWQETNMQYAGNVQFGGFGAFDGALLTNDTIYANHGHIWTADAPDYNLLVAALEPGWFDSWFEELTKREETMVEALTAFYEQTLKNRWYEETKAGHEDVMRVAEFSFRTAEHQYKTYADDTPKFRLYEDRWQHLARTAGGGGMPWVEFEVTTQGIRTMPYPGTEVFESNKTYIEMDTTMFDEQTGTSKSRGDAGTGADIYLDPKYGDPQGKSLNAGYLVIG